MEELIKQLGEKIENLKAEQVKKEEIDALKNQVEEIKKSDMSEALKGRLDTLADEIASLKETKTESKERSLKEILSENKEALKAIAKGSTEEVVIKANTARASITGNTNGTTAEGIGQLAYRKLSAYDIFQKIQISDNNDNGVIRYNDWDEATTVRAMASISEGSVYPEDTAKWTQNTLSLQKIGSTLPVTDEFFKDSDMFASELDLFMRTSVDMKVDTDLINGNGTSPNIKGILTYAPTFTAVASGISDASIYDLIIKTAEHISLTGGAKYNVDFVFMNITDINKMKLKKDANKNYVIPPFVSKDGQQVSTVVVIENNAVTANSMVVGDSRFARIYEKGGVEISRGYVNDQFAKDMMTLKVSKRLALLVKNADLSGFRKVTSISGALTTLAT